MSSSKQRSVCEARYVDALALTNCFDVWEEHGTARHVSTLACVHGGLMAASRMLELGALQVRADQVRLAAREGTVRLGRFVKSNESDAVDASLLWLATPFGVVEPGDPHFRETVRTIERELTFEGGLRRYADDIYYGSGAWPVLTASLGWHYAIVGDRDAAQRCQAWVADRIDSEGRLAEQFARRTSRSGPLPAVGRGVGKAGVATSPGPTRCTWCSARNWKPKQTSSRELPDDGRATWKYPSGGLEASSTRVVHRSGGYQ